MRLSNRPTFRETMNSTRVQAAESAWKRARLASELRHLAAANGDRRAARTLAQIKKEAIRLAAWVLPEHVKVTIDNDYQVGMLSIRWKGHGSLHLPANTPFVSDCETAVIRA